VSASTLWQLSAGEISAGIARGNFSALEVTQALLARTEALNPTLNAIVTLNPAVLEEAAACDRRRQAGESARPLEGVPFVAKDILPTRGLRTTFGSLLLEHHVPDEDALSVARLRAAGAVLLGKTNTPEFAHDVNTTNRVFGTTRNPWALNVTAGGSSGGTAAALAAGLAPVGLGTDLGGSIRIPSSFCGTVGIRPSPGRVPVHPTEFAWDTLVQHVQGPMTRTVEDTGRLLAVLAGPDDRDPGSLPAQGSDYLRAASGGASLAGRRIAYLPDLAGLVPVHPEVARLTRTAVRRFEALGCTVEEVDFQPSGLREIIHGTRGFGMIARYAQRLEEHRELLTPPLVNQVTAALELDVRTVTEAERLRSAYWHRVRALFERFDYLVSPVCGAPPFRLDAPLPTEVGGRPVENFYDVFLFCYAFSVTGLPIVAVPCGLTGEGLPVGMQIVAPRLREDLALEAAAAYAAAAPECFRLPTVDLAGAAPLAEGFATAGPAFRRGR
jgi:amidase